nr:hypothetical protein [Tanacetum cinerariifolium]
MKDVLKENERLLEQAISTDIVNIVVNANMNYACKTVNECERCAIIETELQRDYIKKECYDKLNNSFSQQIAPTFDQLFEINDLKAQSQEKDTIIMKLKERIKSLSGVNLLTSASGSQPQGNAKKDRIQQTQSRAKKNKLEDHPMNVKPSLHNKKSVVNTKAISFVPNSKLNVNSDLKCATYSGCSKHMTGDRSQLINFVQKFLGTVKFRNDHVAKIMGYDRVDLLTGSRGNNLYTLSLGDMMASSPICLLSKASKTKSWLWHRRLSHLNFGAINHLARQGLVRGLPKLKFEKDHLCSACAMGKTSVNGKKYILVIVDDYSRFTWVKCLRSKVEAPDFIIKFLKMIKVRLKVPVCRIQTDNGTEFVNQTLREYYDQVGISHETSVARSPQQNGIVERCNRTLIEAACTMVDPPAPEVIALIVDVIPPVQDVSTGSHSSTTVDQDAHSPSKSQTTLETQSPVIPQDVEVAHIGNDPLFGMPIPEATSAYSSSTVSPHTIVKSNHQIPQHNSK